MPADEHILILQHHGPGKFSHSRMIEEASEFESGNALSDHSLTSMPTISGKDPLV